MHQSSHPATGTVGQKLP